MHDLAIHGVRSRDVVEVALVQSRDVHQYLGAGHRGRRGRRGGRKHAGGPLVCVQPTRDLEHAVTSARVLRVEGEQPREGIERPRVVAKSLVAKLGHAPQQVAPLVGRRSELEVDLEHAHELRHLVALGVHGLEDDGRSGAQLRHVENFLDQLPRLSGRRALAQNLFQIGQRGRRVPDPREEERPESLLKIDLLVTYRGLKPSLEQLGQPIPSLLRCVEAIERPNRLLVHRVELEDALVVSDGADPVAGDLLRDERHLGQQLGATRRLGCRRHDSLVESRQVTPLLARRENLLEALEGALVARLPRQHPLEVRPGAVHVAQLLVEQRRRTLGQVELHALR